MRTNTNTATTSADYSVAQYCHVEREWVTILYSGTREEAEHHYKNSDKNSDLTRCQISKWNGTEWIVIKDSKLEQP